ncbi:MAG: hypothetical protein M3Y91_07765 [Actinomycetota bacterium]|nr:hypothetical protein [Actinomycetota bacterium]
MIKRLAATVLLMMALSVTALGFGVASATAQSAANGPTTPYGNQGGSSTTDPCPVGNGATGTTNPNCVTSAQPADPPAVVTQTASFGNQQGNQSGSGGLAFTGTDVIGTVIVGFVLIGGGMLVVRFSRRRPSA